ncbi:hypothetical protein Esti_003277 [Eimeria stiedai]
MADPQTPTTAAERAAATIAAAAEAAAAEEAAAAATDDEHSELLAAPAGGRPYAAAATTSAGEKQRLRLQRGVSPTAGAKPFVPGPTSHLHAREALLLSQQRRERPLFASSKAPSRACQWLRCLPVVFVMLLVLYLDVVYIANFIWFSFAFHSRGEGGRAVSVSLGSQYHCLPQLQLRVPPNRRNLRRFNRGAYEILVFVVLSFLFVSSYWLAVVTPAGSIPKTPKWELGVEEGGPTHPALTGTIETKRGGGQRACKWCKQRKPDRAHHCRVCRACVLKMDHHCPWIFNCVGFGNHKFFMLTLLWGAALSIFVAVTMLPTVKAAIRDEQVCDHSIALSLRCLFADTRAWGPLHVCKVE